MKEQIIEARTFVNRLMSELPEDLWYVIPEGTDSNFIWQVGHLLVSQNFHTLTAVTGVDERVGRWMPIQNIIEYLMAWGHCIVPSRRI